MHAPYDLFSWSMKLLAFISRLSAPKMLDHLHTTYHVCHSNPFVLVSERSGRNTKRCVPRTRTYVCLFSSAGSVGTFRPLKERLLLLAGKSIFAFFSLFVRSGFIKS